MLQAHHARWSTLFTLGDLHGTETHAREGLSLCEADRRTTLAYGGHDTGICARVFCARALALGGRTDAAAALCDDAVTAARELDHPFTLAFTLMHVAAVHETRRDASRGAGARGRSDAGRARAQFWSHARLGDLLPGMVDGAARRSASGPAMLDEGVAAARATGSVLFQPHMLGLLASAQTANGLLTEARRTVDDAFAISDRTGERFYAAELHRLKGELRLAESDDAASRRLAEHDFLTAIRLADDQGAHQLVLRAAVSLARLSSRAGKRSEAVRPVLDARGRLDEGAALPDMVEAGAVIADAQVVSR